MSWLDDLKNNDDWDETLKAVRYAARRLIDMGDLEQFHEGVGHIAGKLLDRELELMLDEVPDVFMDGHMDEIRKYKDVLQVMMEIAVPAIPQMSKRKIDGKERLFYGFAWIDGGMIETMYGEIPDKKTFDEVFNIMETMDFLRDADSEAELMEGFHERMGEILKLCHGK